MSDTDRALAAFEPMTLGEMDRVSLMNRVDTKYVFSQDRLAGLLEKLAQAYRVLGVEGARRTAYESLYFDTPARDCFRDHHRGKPRRYKFRMRRYASSGLAFFEVKQKTNRGRTIKRRRPIDTITHHLDGDSHGLAEDCVGRPIELGHQLWTRFSRLTLIGRDAPERVTIDTGLRFEDDNRGVAAPRIAIAEVKQDQDRRGSAIRQLLRATGVRPLRVSKYCLGATLLDPSIRSNLFRAKLKRLRRYA